MRNYLMLAITLGTIGLLTACGTVPLRTIETTTITYPDGRTETVERSEFNQEAWESVLEGARGVREIAQELREDEEMTPEERAARQQELEMRAEMLERLIGAVRDDERNTNDG